MSGSLPIIHEETHLPVAPILLAGRVIAFMTLAAIATVGLGWFWLAMPETKKS